MIFDAIRRLFGINSRPPEQYAPRSWEDSSSSQSTNGVIPSHPFSDPQPLDIIDMDIDINRIHSFMDGQMRSLLESFNFMFGTPTFIPGPDDGDHQMPQGRGVFPFSFGIQGLPGSRWGGTFGEIPHEGTLVPTQPGADGNLDPRDEVLKPQFRGQRPVQRKDEDLDALVKKEGPSVVLDIMKPGHTDRGGASPPSLWSWSGSIEPQISSSSVVTIYRNINGHSTYEKIIRHPDGRVDRTVIESDDSSNQPGPVLPDN